nr:triple gene block protein 2 [Poplar mosaic virus]
MPLSPPPDHSKTFLVAAAGLSLVLCLYTLTRSTLPGVGDNIHSLPHGGQYRDGTKSINYCSPGKSYPSSNLLRGGHFPALCAILLISGAILISYRFQARGACSRCGVTH